MTPNVHPSGQSCKKQDLTPDYILEYGRGRTRVNRRDFASNPGTGFALSPGSAPGNTVEDRQCRPFTRRCC